jgi:hypothetical protein
MAEYPDSVNVMQILQDAKEAAHRGSTLFIVNAKTTGEMDWVKELREVHRK